MASTNDEGPGFWPGYVAAVSGLVQGLLIMAMALGLAIFGLSVLIKETEQRKRKVANESSSNNLKYRTYKPQSTKSILSNETVEKKSLTDEKNAELPSITIEFFDAAIDVPLAANFSIEQWVEARRNLGTKHWRISLKTTLLNPLLRRNGYLRLMSVRNSLIKFGVPAENIVMELLNSTENFESGSQRVKIEPINFGVP